MIPCRFAIILLVLTQLFSCKSKKTELAWKQSLPQIGSQSSPRTAELNGDGILDIVMGGGLNEYQQSDYSILAFDGKTGEIIWNQKGIDQIYGSATFIDVNKDGTEDIFIGGRSNQFMGLNGKTGEKIWEYKFKYESDSILKNARYNFQNTVKIPDQNGDGIAELLVQNGGNSKAAPGTMNDRLPGVLMIIDPLNGNILFSDIMPDRKESYMPPLFFRQADGKEWLIFGTGGETIGGNLYITEFDNLKNRKLSNAKIIARETGHGFIAPPSLADINGDGNLDIVAISHGSSIFAIDGKNFEPIWQKRIDFTECSNAFAVGQFTGDETPDFFTFVSKGIWPESKGSIQVMIDGKTGEIAYQNSLGCTGFSSPVVYDLNNDGIDEAIISINNYDCEQGFTSEAKLDISNKLIAIDFKSGEIQNIDEQAKFKNIFSTPWIGDLDKDNYLDIVYCKYYSPNSNLLAFMGMEIRRISTHIKIKRPVLWGAYMGSNGDGIFKK